MIAGSENIVQIFNAFHDGVIESYQCAQGVVTLKIGISYLAELINPSYEYFELRLYGVNACSLETWETPSTERKISNEMDEAFADEPEILSAQADKQKITILLSYTFDKGGQLFLIADCAEVFDQGGKSWSLEQLNAICESYWKKLNKQ